jgi:hypothetical protein
MLIDLDTLGEFETVIAAQMRPIEANGRQMAKLGDVLGLLRYEAWGGDSRAVGMIMRLTANA